MFFPSRMYFPELLLFLFLFFWLILVLFYKYIFDFPCPILLLCFLQVLQAQLSSLLQGKENIQSSCSFTEQALSHGTATEVGVRSHVEKKKIKESHWGLLTDCVSWWRLQVLLVQKQMSERVTALARHDFPERPQQNAHLDCQVKPQLCTTRSSHHSIV